MLKIGDFSRLSQIGIHALRNYDKIGLLQPEHIDNFTGYRYYTLQQLPRAHRIMALKEMGLSLEQIGIMLNQDMSIEELRGMFRLKQAEVEQRLREEQKRLAMLEFHLHMIELEDKMPELNVVMKEIEPYNALYMRESRSGQEVIDTQTEIREMLASGAVQTTGPQVNAFFGSDVQLEKAVSEMEAIDFAFSIPVSESHIEDIQLPTKGTLSVRKVAGVKAATMIINGLPLRQTMNQALVLQRWAIENGYALCDESRLVFFQGPEPDSPRSEWVWELQVIVETE